MEEKKLVVFQNKKIRRIWFENEWYFSVIDVVEVLTESENSRRYWSDLKRKLKKEGLYEPYESIVQLKMESSDGKKRETDCSNTEGLFRIIQSIPSPKAEPFKQWLAKVGYERIQEIENPEIANERIKEIYRKKGDNLRDHMTDLELIFTMLGEASTTEIARKKDAIGFDENEKAAKEGGKIAGDARNALEKKTGEKVSIKDNYKEIPESKKKALTKSKK